MIDTTAGGEPGCETCTGYGLAWLRARPTSANAEGEAPPSAGPPGQPKPVVTPHAYGIPFAGTIGPPSGQLTTVKLGLQAGEGASAYVTVTMGGETTIAPQSACASTA